MRRYVYGAFALGGMGLIGCQQEHASRPTSILAGPTPKTARMQNIELAPPTTNPKPQSFLNITPPRPEQAQPARTSTRIMATVNGAPIFEHEVREAALSELVRLRGPDAKANEKAIFEKYLQSIIDRELLYQDAIQKFSKNQRALDRIREMATKDFEQWLRKIRIDNKLKSDEELKDMLASQGITLDEMKKQNERRFIADEYLRFMILNMLDEIGHGDLVKYYLEHGEEFMQTDNVEWHHIFLDVVKYASIEEMRQRAADIVAGLQRGESISKYIPYDDGDTKARNGFGRGRKKGEIRPIQAEAILFTLKDGEVGAPIEVPTGIHIVRLVKREYAGQRRPFDEKVQSQIRDRLRSELGQRESQRIKNELRRKAHIEIANP